MIFTEATRDYFSKVQFKVRSALARSASDVPFAYDDESFFQAYDLLYQIWVKRKSQRAVAETNAINRQKLKDWETGFTNYGTVGLLPELSFVDVDPQLERLVILVKTSRPHERANSELLISMIL